MPMIPNTHLLYPSGGGGGAAGSGFTARKSAASGSVDTLITGWSEDWDTDGAFDPSAGEWVVPASGLAVIMASGFPNPLVNFGTTSRLSMRESDVEVGGLHGQSRRITDQTHGHCNFVAGILEVTAAEVYSLYQEGMTAEDAVFSALYIDTAVAAYAYKLSATGSAGGDIDTLTEHYDLGGDMNPTTGIFTAPSTGRYLIAAGGLRTTSTTANNIQSYIDGVDTGIEQFSKAHTVGTNHSVNALFMLDLTAGEELKYKQNGVTANNFNFSVALIAPTSSFSARLASAASAPAALTGFSEDWDDGGHFNAATGVYTAPNTGTYLVMAHATGNSNNKSVMELRVNGTKHIEAGTEFSLHSVAETTSLAAALQLTAADTVSLYNNSDDGGQTEAYFAIIEVSTL